MLHEITLSLFCLMLITAATMDVMTLRIPNWLNIAIALLFLPAAYLGGMPLGVFGCHLAVGAIMLLAGIVLFAAGAFGGGDAKLLAAAALWLGCAALMPFLLWTSIWGLGLALWMGARGWASGRRGRALLRTGVPYGVALATGAIMALPTSWWLPGAG